MTALEVVQPEEEGKKVCPACKQALPQKHSLNEMRKLIWCWKELKSIPNTGPRSEGWNKANWGRFSKAAKSLLDMFGSLEKAVEAIEFIHEKLTDQGLTCTIETIIKRSDLFYEELARRGE